VKVIAGFLGGRKLKTLPSAQTRPTSAKIRGAIFNTLGQYFDETVTVLDLFAGSGALSIEAISRGSGRTVCVENNRAACNIIKENYNMLGIRDKLSLYCGSYVKYLMTNSDEFDLIFIDPPYAMKVIEDIVNTLFDRGIVRRRGRIVIELSNAVYDSSDLNFLEKHHVIFNRSYDMTRIIIIEYAKGENYE